MVEKCTHGLRKVVRCLIALSALNIAAVEAQATAQMALDKGCYSCHGNPPRKNVPSFDQLAADYAKYRGVPSAEDYSGRPVDRTKVLAPICLLLSGQFHSSCD